MRSRHGRVVAAAVLLAVIVAVPSAAVSATASPAGAVTASPAGSATAAAGPDAEEVAAALGQDGIFVDPAAGAVDVESMRASIDQAHVDGVTLTVVVLAETPEAGAQGFARVVLDERPIGTVVVFAPDAVGLASIRFSDEQLEAALARASAAPGAEDPAVLLAGLYRQVSAPARDARILTLLGLGLAGLVLLLVLGATAVRSRRRLSTHAAVTARRAAIGPQLDAVIREAGDLADAATTAGGVAHHEFTDIREKLRRVEARFSADLDPEALDRVAAQIRGLSSRLDQLRRAVETAHRQ